MKIGIDVGSTGIKIVFVEGDRFLWKKVVPTRPGQAGLARDLVREGMGALKIRDTDIETTCVTGYGRNLIDAKTHTVDEIWANAAGIFRLTSGRAATLINIGGQDVKIIRISPEGHVTDFKMNDKCAAGTGRFFEIAANILDTPLSQFHIPDAIEPANINSTCAVFAESEIVSLLAKGIEKERIIRGINQSVAKRIAGLAGNSLPEAGVWVDGGPAKNKGLVEALEDQLLCDIHVVDEPQFTVAFGALFVD